jgi:nucleotide-binding universal stress UspA family protein
MSTIIVGVDESQGSIDAIALASRLAGITGSELMLVNVFPYDLHPSRAANRAFEEYLRRDSNDLLERRRSSLGDKTVEVRAIPDVSSARGLHELAEQENAGLVVVGSTHTGRAGRVLPGSTAERLLHGSPCPVAVAPKGYAQRSSDELAVIGCGYDASLSAAHALETAHRLAVATGARLRVIRVFKPLAFDTPPDSVLMGGMASYNDTLHERATRELESAIATIDAERGVEAEFTIGDPEQLLAEASEQLDLLVVGSRGYGPMHAVMVGGVAGRLVREAACPVIVVPRGAGHTEADSLFAKTAVATHA